MLIYDPPFVDLTLSGSSTVGRTRRLVRMALAQMHGTPSSELVRGASAALGASGASSALPGSPTTSTHSGSNFGEGADGKSARGDSFGSGPGVALKGGSALQGGATSAGNGLRRCSAMAGANDDATAGSSDEEHHVSFSDSTKRNSGGPSMYPETPEELVAPGGRPGGVTHPEGDPCSDSEMEWHGGARSLLKRSPVVRRRGGQENTGVQKRGGRLERREAPPSRGEGTSAERGGGGVLGALWRRVVSPHRPHTLQHSNAMPHR